MNAEDFLSRDAYICSSDDTLPVVFRTYIDSYTSSIPYTRPVMEVYRFYQNCRFGFLFVLGHENELYDGLTLAELTNLFDEDQFDEWHGEYPDTTGSNELMAWSGRLSYNGQILVIAEDIPSDYEGQPFVCATGSYCSGDRGESSIVILGSR